MSNRSTILALAAIAALGTMAVSNTSAMATAAHGASSFKNTATRPMGLKTSSTLGVAVNNPGHGVMGVKVTGMKPPMGVKVTGMKPPGPTGLKIPPGQIPGVKVTGIPPHPIGWNKPPMDECGWKHHCGDHWPPVIIGGGIDVEPVPYPVIGGGVVATTPVAVGGYAPAPVAAGPCTCLTKTYLQDGSVLFKDVCTTEAAVANPAQMQGMVQSR
jgi:hypothetical protein